MLEILTKEGRTVDTTTFVSKHEQDTVNWRINETINKELYDYNIIYLGVQNKPRKLKKLNSLIL
jgi:hypothetical protein